MEREPDSLVDQHLDELYDKALREGAIPWEDAACSCGECDCRTREIEEAFPDEP